MPHVFIPEIPSTRFDLSTAELFGDIVYLCQKLYPFKPEECADSLYNALIDNNYDPETDYICLAGSTLSLCILVSVVVSNFGSVRCLMYDARAKTYCERMLTQIIYDEDGEDYARCSE